MKNNPYVGPRPYEIDDQEKFFGRDRESSDLVALIMSEREVLLYAPSGAGKTSLLKASVIPALVDNYNYHVLPVARVGFAVPKDIDPQRVKNVFTLSLLLSLAGEGADPNLLLDHTLSSYLKATLPPNELVVPESEDLEESSDDNKLPVLIIDQFEELFTAHRDHWQDMRPFIEQVREALDELPKLGMAFSMREDHIASLDPFLGCFSHRLRARYRLELLGERGAMEAVRLPAEKQGVSFDAAAAQELVRNLSQIKVKDLSGKEQITNGPTVEAVQLQVVCREMWDALEETTAIGPKEVKEHANVDQALTKFYERAVAAAAKTDGVTERDVRNWFSKTMITPQGRRVLVLEGDTKTENLKNDAVKILEDQHIIRAEMRAGARYYEIAHDRLVDPIKTSNEEWQTQRETPLHAAAVEWAKTKNNELLYRGSTLKTQLAWAEQHAGEVEPEERLFLDASVKAQQRIQGLGICGLLFLIIVLSVLTLSSFIQAGRASREASTATVALGMQQIAMNQAANDAATAVAARSTSDTALILSNMRGTEAANQAAIASTAEADAERETNISQARLLASQALNLASSKNNLQTRAALLALESLRRHPEAQGVEAISNVLDRIPTTINQVFLVAPPKGAAISPDGRWMAASTVKGDLRVWDIASSKIAWQFTDSGMPYTQILFSPDSQTLMMVYAERGVAYYRIETGEYIGAQFTETPITAAAYSPDGRSSAVGCADGSIKVISDEAYPLVDIQAGESPITALVFHPKDNLLASGDMQGNVTIHLFDKEFSKEWDRTSVSGAVSTIAFSPDGSLFAVADNQESRGTITVSSAGWISRAEWAGFFDQPINGISFSPDGAWLLTAHEDNKVRVWDNKEGKEFRIVDHKSPVTSAAFSPDGSRIVSGSRDGQLWVWDTRSGEKTASTSLVGPVLTASFNGDGRIFAASADGGIILLNADTLKFMFQDVFFDTIPAVLVDPNGAYVLTASQGGAAMVLDITTTEVETISKMTHTGSLPVIALSPDGKQAAAGSSDGTVLVWDVKTGRELFTQKMNGGVRSLSFSPAGQPLLAAGDTTGTSCVWDFSIKAEKACRSDRKGQVNVVAFSVDGKWVASGGEDGSTVVWVAETGVTVSSHLSDGAVNMLSLYQEADTIGVVAASSDGSIVLWNAATGVEEMILIKGVSPVTTFAISPNNLILAAGDENGNLHLFTGGEETYRIAHDGRINSIQFSPDSRRIITASNDRTARLWDVETGEELARVSENGLVTSAVMAPDNQTIISASADGFIRVWKAPMGREKLVLQNNYTEKVVYSPDGKYLMAVGGETPVKVWEASSGKMHYVINRTSDNIYTARYSPDGQQIIVASGEQEVLVYDATNGELVFTISAPVEVYDAVFSSRGDALLFAGDGIAQVWDHQTQEIRQFTYIDDTPTLQPGTSGDALQAGDLLHEVHAAVFSPDGSLLAAGYTNKVQIWELSNQGKPRVLGDSGDVTGLAFSPDGSRLVSANADGVLKMWYTSTWEEAKNTSMKANSYVDAITFSPDGSLFMAGGDDGIVRVWDSREGSLVTQFELGNSVLDAAFSPDSRYVVTASTDSTARVWEVATGVEISRMVYSGWVRSVTFTPDGQYAVSAGDDGTVRVWIWQYQQMIDLACSRLDRNLTREEWEQYIGKTEPYRKTCENLPDPVVSESSFR